MKFETQLLILDVFEALRVVLIARVEIVMKIVMKIFFSWSICVYASAICLAMELRK